MKCATAVLLLVAFVACFAIGQVYFFLVAIGQLFAKRPFVVEDLHAVQRLSGFSVSPNGKTAAYAVRGWVRTTNFIFD
jgi:hypothetical protein